MELATHQYVDFPGIRIVDLDAPELLSNDREMLEVATKRMFAEPTILETLASVSLAMRQYESVGGSAPSAAPEAAERVPEVERKVLDDEEVVCRPPPRHGTRAGSPRAIRRGWCPRRILVHWSERGSVKETSHRGCSGQRPVDLADSATSYGRDHRPCRGAVHVHGRRGGASGARRRASMVFRASRLGPIRLLTVDAAALPPPPPPRALYAGKDADSGYGRMVLLPARALSAGVRQSSPLVVVPPPRVASSTIGAPVVPRRSPPPGSHAAAWLQRQGSRTPAEKVAERQRWRSRPRWRVGCCRMLVRVPAVLARGRAAGRQPDGTRVGRCSPRGVPPARERRGVPTVGRRAQLPCPTPGGEGPAPRRAGTLPLQVRRVAPAAGRRRRGGAESAPVWSCSMRRPHRRCTPVWDRAVAWSVVRALQVVADPGTAPVARRPLT
jgi:hypothetical protein